MLINKGFILAIYMRQRSNREQINRRVTEHPVTAELLLGVFRSLAIRSF